MAPYLGQLGSHDARGNVDAAAGRETDEQAARLVGVTLRNGVDGTQSQRRGRHDRRPLPAAHF